jgi:hypothetical protein
MEKGLYKKVHVLGPGGLKCNCCNAVPKGKNNSKKTNKIFLNKLVRRALKLELED